MRQNVFICWARIPKTNTFWRRRFVLKRYWTDLISRFHAGARGSFWRDPRHLFRGAGESAVFCNSKHDDYHVFNSQDAWLKRSSRSNLQAQSGKQYVEIIVRPSKDVSDHAQCEKTTNTKMPVHMLRFCNWTRVWVYVCYELFSRIENPLTDARVPFWIVFITAQHNCSGETQPDATCLTCVWVSGAERSGEELHHNSQCLVFLDITMLRPQLCPWGLAWRVLPQNDSVWLGFGYFLHSGSERPSSINTWLYRRCSRSPLEQYLLVGFDRMCGLIYAPVRLVCSEHCGLGFFRNNTNKDERKPNTESKNTNHMFRVVQMCWRILPPTTVFEPLVCATGLTDWIYTSAMRTLSLSLYHTVHLIGLSQMPAYL